MAYSQSKSKEEGYVVVGDIFEAAQSGNIAMVENYLDLGFPPDLTDEDGYSILHHAASHGQVEVIKLLHEGGCCIDPLDKHGRTPLHHAATSEEAASIGVLVILGCNVNSLDNEGNTPLRWAVRCEKYSALEELLKYGGVEEVEGEPSHEQEMQEVVHDEEGVDSEEDSGVEDVECVKREQKIQEFIAEIDDESVREAVTSLLDKWKKKVNLLDVDDFDVDKLANKVTSDDEMYLAMFKLWMKHGPSVASETLFEVCKVGQFFKKFVKKIVPSRKKKQSAMNSPAESEHVSAVSVAHPTYLAHPRPHPSQESSVDSSIPDTRPSDSDLQGVLAHAPVWHNLAIALGVPINQVMALQQDPMGGLRALQHWRNGLSGEGYPNTWRFLLEAVKTTQDLGPYVAKSLEELAIAATNNWCSHFSGYSYPVVPRPHPPLEPLSTVHVVQSSVQDSWEQLPAEIDPFYNQTPCDIALLAIVEKIPSYFKLAVKLGVPIDQVKSFQQNPDEGGLLALHYWVSGKSGEKFPTTWRFLLEAIKEVIGSRVAEDLEEKARTQPTWSRDLQ